MMEFLFASTLWSRMAPAEFGPLIAEIAPAPATFARACSAPQTKAEVLACTGARASIWVNQMSSGCSTTARPQTQVAVQKARPGGQGGPLGSGGPNGMACFGPACFDDSIPLATASSTDDGRSPFVASTLALPLFFDATPLFEAETIGPESPPPRRLLRPPTAA